MPSSLHAQLARDAENEGVSLNQFVVAALAASVQWRSREDASVIPRPLATRLDQLKEAEKPSRRARRR
jgi:hypothetical protein